MKQILKKGFTFNKFLIGLFVFFFLIAGFRASKFFWDSKDISKQQVSILTQNTYTSEGLGDLYVTLKNVTDDKFIKKAQVEVFIEDLNGIKIGDLNQGELVDGYLSISFKLPVLNSGSYNLVTKISSSEGKDEVKKTITVKQQERLIISTDRPLYKPGQSMNWRVLLLDKLTLKPLENKEVFVSVVDPSDNKLFRKSFKTSKYGIVSGDFGFGNELAFGGYKIEADVDGNVVEKTVEVKEFQLPKFEVKLKTNEDLTKPQSKITGQVTAKFFHGQPVTGAKTKVFLNIDNHQEVYDGVIDRDGILNFSFISLNEKDVKNIKISAEVVDQNQNKITAQNSYNVTGENIIVELFPESGKLKPGLDNDILIVTSRSDGTPVATTVFMTGEKLREFTTNEYGLAKLTYKPYNGQLVSHFALDVRDEFGNVVKKTFDLNNDSKNVGYLLLRTDKTLYDNNILKLNIFSTIDQLAQIEMLQDGMVLHSEPVEIKNGKGEKSIEIPDKVFGTVELRAIQTFGYQDVVALSKGGYNPTQFNGLELVSDSKIIFVDKAKNLKINITSNKETYLPGEEAKFSFNITDEDNNNQDTALGVKIVDEALLSLQSDSDNFSKLMFLVDDKVRDYAQSLNGLTWQDIIKSENSELNNIILQAMMQNVPREDVSFAKQEKDNSSAWYSYKRQREGVFSTIVFFFFIILFIFHLRFWSQATKISYKKGVTSRIWLLIVAVFIASVFVGAIFTEERRYGGGRVEKVLHIAVDDVFREIVVSDYFLHGVLVVFIVLAVTGWKMRNIILKEYKEIGLSYGVVGVVFLSLTILSGTGILNRDSVGFVAMMNLILLIQGLLYVRTSQAMEKDKLNPLSATLIVVMGILSVFFFPGMILVLVLVAIIGFGRLISATSGVEDAEELLKLRESLEKEGKSKDVIDVELFILKRKLKNQDSSSKVDRFVIYFILALISFVLLKLFFTSLDELMSARTTAIYRSVDELSLGTGDIRDTVTNYVNILMGFLGMTAVVSIFVGVYKKSVIGDFGNKRKAKLLITSGSVALVVLFVGYIISYFMVNSLMTATGSDSYSSNDSFNSGVDDCPNCGFSSGSSRFSAPTGLEYASQLNLGTADVGSMGLMRLFNPTPKEIIYQKTQTKESKVVLPTDKSEVNFKKADRIRKFFPETMFWQADLIAENGQAELTVPIKDSVTSWRLSALGNSLSGKIGSQDKNVVAFQDFFIDFDVPYNLTKGDEFWLPITVHNYLSESQQIKLNLKNSDFYTWIEGGKEVEILQPNEFKNIFVKLRLEKNGDYVLQVEAQGSKMADAVEKSVHVSPFGQHIAQTVASEKLNEEEVKVNAIFPNNKIAGTEKIMAKIYPTVFSEMVEGLDSMLRLPSGCFEQTSSSLYPNILILKYLNKSGQELPEVRKKAEDFISQGMQKLLTYELEPGGFSYFGQQPVETILSAYGLMEFSDMRNVVFVDESLINRTRKFLYSRQNRDGSFQMIGMHQGGFSGNDDLAKNAYIIWALSEADSKNSDLAKSIKYLENNLSEIEKSPYALALTLNAFVNFNPQADYTKKAASKLKQFIERGENNLTYIKIKTPNYYGSYGYSGDVEVTALSAVALTRLGEFDFSDSLVSYIINKKSGNGSWGSTQSTILALKALAENEIAKKTVKNNLGSLTITLNNGESKKIEISPENSEVVQYLVFDDNLKENNEIKMVKEGKIDANIQIVKDYYRNWDNKSTSSTDFSISQELLQVGEKSGLKLGQVGFFLVNASSNKNVKNAIVEVSIPAGFEINASSLSCYLKNTPPANKDLCASVLKKYQGGRFSRFEIKAGQVVFYYDELIANQKNNFPIIFTPRTVGKFKILPARIYAYYDPYNEAFSKVIGEVEVEYADASDVVNISLDMVSGFDDQADIASTKMNGFSEAILNYDGVYGLVGIGNKIAFMAYSDKKGLIVYDGKEIGREYDLVQNPTSINDKLAFVARSGTKWFIVHDGKKVYESNSVIMRLANIDNKIAFTTYSNKKTVVFFDGKEIDQGYGTVSMMVDINGKIAFIASDDNKKWFVVYDGRKIGGEYDYVSDLINLNGEPVFIARSDNKTFVVYNDKKVVSDYDNISKLSSINNKLSFVFTNKKGNWVVMYGDKVIDNGYSYTTSPIGADDGLSFVAIKNGKVFIVHDDQELEVGKYGSFSGGNVAGVGGKVAFLINRDNQYVLVREE